MHLFHNYYAPPLLSWEIMKYPRDDAQFAFVCWFQLSLIFGVFPKYSSLEVKQSLCMLFDYDGKHHTTPLPWARKRNWNMKKENQAGENWWICCFWSVAWRQHYCSHKCKWEAFRKLYLLVTIQPQIVRDDTTNGVDVNSSEQTTRWLSTFEAKWSRLETFSRALQKSKIHRGNWQKHQIRD